MFGKKHKKRSHPFTSAVVLCAGSSTRMGGLDKQTVMLWDWPVYMHSVFAFEQSEFVDEIVLVVKEDLIPEIGSSVRDCGCQKVTSIVKGGSTRALSSSIGAKAVSRQAEYLLIHDGARPLIDRGLIDRVAGAVYEWQAVAPGCRIAETVKQVDEDQNVVSTVNRDFLWTVQTPQAFEKNLYLSALEHAEANSFFDDCQMVEQYGRTVHMVEGSRRNIKLTTVEDIALAQALLEMEE